MKVYISALAEAKLKQLTEYLLEAWSYNVKMEFLKKLTAKIEQISKHPESCPQSREYEGLYKCVVTRQTTFYYRINKSKGELEIITVFDTRQNSDKLRKDLK